MFCFSPFARSLVKRQLSISYELSIIAVTDNEDDLYNKHKVSYWPLVRFNGHTLTCWLKVSAWHRAASSGDRSPTETASRGLQTQAQSGSPPTSAARLEVPSYEPSWFDSKIQRFKRRCSHFHPRKKSTAASEGSSSSAGNSFSRLGILLQRYLSFG